jgi:hypothetical protein
MCLCECEQSGSKYNMPLLIISSLLIVGHPYLSIQCMSTMFDLEFILLLLVLFKHIRHVLWTIEFCVKIYLGRSVFSRSIVVR